MRDCVLMDLRFFVILLCFFLSGFSALLYQTAWTREFSFVFGTSEIAVAVVLAGYMGGLALGSAAAARFAPKVTRPIWVYGALELGIAGSALALPFGLEGLTAAYVAMFAQAAPAEPETAATLFRFVSAFVLMMIPTGLMGATLPLLARHAIRRHEEIGPRVGGLYAINTAGAIAGTLIAGFLLLPQIGLRQTVYVGALGNLLVFLAAAALSRRAPVPLTSPPSSNRLEHRWVLPLMLLSGAVSFSYEVMWTRLLAQILGGSLFAFTTMLSSFLLGIAVGSAVGGAVARRAGRAAIGLAIAELGVAACGLAAFLAADQLPALGQALGAGWRASLWTNAPLAAVVLIPVALCLGATFPFAVRLLTPNPAESAAATARVYAWNTVGGIAGSVATGFFLIPALHFAGTALLGTILSLGLAAFAAWRAQPRSVAVLAGVGGLVLVLLLLPPANPWNLLLTSPFYQRKAEVERIHFQAAGRSSTVVLLEEPSGFILYTNGLPESRIVRYSSTPERGAEARALGWLPAALRPEAKRGLVIGLGGAVALEGIPPSIDSVDVIELEPEVVTANRRVGQTRLRDPLSDPRFRFIQNDARGALMLAQRPYDMIISQPSHPWTAGASHLYTQEFFELVEDRLTPDGVFVQWIGLGFVDAPLLRSLLATLTAVFPEVQIYRPHGPALVFVASNTPFDLTQSARALEKDPLHFKQLGIRSPSEIAAAWVLDTDGARALAQGAAPNTDDWNQLATRSSRLEQGSLTLPQFNALVRRYDPLRGRAETVAPLPLILSLAQRGEIQRATTVARELKGVDRPLALTLIAATRGEMGRARQRLQQAHALAPDSAAVEEVAELLEMPWPAPPSASASADTIQRAREQAEREHWGALAQLDSALAQIEAGELLYDEALRLRALWRVQGNDRQRNEEAIALIDEQLAYSSKGGTQLERARAAAGAGRITEAWVTLDQALGKLMAAPRRHTEELAEARLLARELPDDPEAERVVTRNDLFEKPRSESGSEIRHPTESENHVETD